MNPCMFHDQDVVSKTDELQLFCRTWLLSLVVMDTRVSCAGPQKRP